MESTLLGHELHKGGKAGKGFLSCESEKEVHVKDDTQFLGDPTHKKAQTLDWDQG